MKNEVRALQELDGVADENEVFEIRSKINARLKLIVESIILNFDLQVAEVRFKSGIVRHVHERGVFANILPPATPEQSAEDMREIEEWASLSNEEKKAKWANDDFKIVPLKI